MSAASSARHATEPLVLVFDGECGFCTAVVAWLQRPGRPGRILAIPCQAERSVRSAGVSPSMCRQEAVAVAPSGARYRGAAAMTSALAYAIDALWLMRIARIWPIRWLAGGVYRLLVRVRRWLPGVTPFCHEHPHLCGELL